ncbi:NUDIX hydrolase [Clostridiisalibacter paucivorans]|uniref:NUDIX hydrolase n=1 Tax=Clostridiisalibacter paucivorans TaxID=408753 RepID=UPI000479CE65|nr:NUDIX hydrolase [Clostridiisalibacter paucivorans]
MLFRSCAGGVVFYKDEVFILKNEKDEWVLPKGKIRDCFLASETAVSRVKEETGVDADIVSSVGETSYEFYSLSRQRPVCNQIIWYIMESDTDQYSVKKSEGFKEGGFYHIDKAVDMITYSQDKSLVSLAYKKYLDLKKEELVV